MHADIFREIVESGQPAQYLSIWKRDGNGRVAAAAKHNLRELQHEIGVGANSHIDPARIMFNKILRGPSTWQEVAALEKALLKEAGIDRTKLRVDAVRLVETVLSLPPSFAFDSMTVFEDFAQWSERNFKVPMLSAVAHFDEGAPHCHVLLLPLVNGKMQGSDLVGGPGKFRARLLEFHKEVGSKYSLQFKEPCKPLSSLHSHERVEQIQAAIQRNPALLGHPDLERALLAAIKKDSEFMLDVLDSKNPRTLYKGFDEYTVAPSEFV